MQSVVYPCQQQSYFYHLPYITETIKQNKKHIKQLKESKLNK